jgi:hypothetical protein
MKKTIGHLRTYKENVVKKFESILEKIPLISPESRLKILWDCIVMMSRLYFLFVIPIDLAWGESKVIYG